METHNINHKGLILAALCCAFALMIYLIGENATIAPAAETPIVATSAPTEAPTSSPSPTPTVTPSPTPSPTPTPVPDTVAPVIEGVQNITVSLGDSISYRKNVTVSDDSGEMISLEIDNSAVIIDQIGIYPIIYSAIDSAGNKAQVEATVTIAEPSGVSPEEVIALADQLIAEKTTADMSDWDKAYTLWNWCRKNIRYTYSAGDRSSVYSGAYEGLHDRQGDCYAYYATYSLLLTRLGIENQCVARVGGTSNHWWNLVNLGDGWYHCDPSPRNKNHLYKCFMQTDAQLQEYCDFYTEHPGYYDFDSTLYPERATTELFDGKPTSVSTPEPTATSLLDAELIQP